MGRYLPFEEGKVTWVSRTYANLWTFAHYPGRVAALPFKMAWCAMFGHDEFPGRLAHLPVCCRCGAWTEASPR